MSKPKTPAYIANAIKRYTDACDKLAMMFLEQLGLGDRKNYDWWWIDEPAGGTLTCQGGEIFVDMEDVVLAVENAMDYDSFMEWYWQWIAHDFNSGEPLPHRINLRSWLMGARPNIINPKE